MIDILNNNFNESKYILFATNSNLVVGKIHSINEHINCIKAIVHSYNYTYVSRLSALSISENQVRQMKDGVELLLKLDEYELTIANKQIEHEKNKAQRANKKKELQKKCIPGKIYSGESSKNTFLYLGQDENKLHMYSKIKIRYCRKSDGELGYYYSFSPYSDELLYKVKSKKVIAKVIEETDYNINQMITMARTRMQTNGSPYCTMNEIDTLESLYLKAVI